MLVFGAGWHSHFRVLLVYLSGVLWLAAQEVSGLHENRFGLRIQRFLGLAEDPSSRMTTLEV